MIVKSHAIWGTKEKSAAEQAVMAFRPQMASLPPPASKERTDWLIISRLALVNGRVARFQDLGEYEGFKEIQPHAQQDGNFL